jgi:WD40 repeat protein
VMAGDSRVTAVKIWDLGPNGDAEWGNLPAAGSRQVEFMPNGRQVVTSTARAVTVWDLETGRRIRTIGPFPFYFVFLGQFAGSFDVSPDGVSIAAGGSVGPGGFGGEVAGAWDAATGEKLFSIEHPLDVNDVAFSPDGEHLVTASWDGSARIVNRSGAVVGVVAEGGGVNITTARFSPDGRLVAAAASLGEGEYGLKIWDWERFDVLSRISTDASSMDFDPSGSRIATAGLTGRAEIWDVESGTRVAVLAGNSGGINDVDFSPDGSRVATAGFDGTVRLFDASTGTQKVVLRGHRCGVQSVAFSPDGRKLASVSACDGVRIWAVDIDDLLGIARQQVKRSLTEEECRQYLHEARCPQA